MLDPPGNAVHTALSLDAVGKDVLVTGAGPIGITAVAVARQVGARHVVIPVSTPCRWTWPLFEDFLLQTLRIRMIRTVSAPRIKEDRCPKFD